MTIAATGAVSLADLRSEFVGGSSAISFSDLYRGGSNIRAKAANNTGVNLAASVPTSGTIDFSLFRSTAKGFKFTFSAGATDQSASTLFGDDYTENYPKIIEIESGVELGATTTSNFALVCPAGALGSLSITNNGTLTGAGGAAGANGGGAFEAAVACVFVNNGTIRAGGGGGGTGGQGSTTSTSQSSGYQLYYCYIVTVWSGRHRYWWGNSGGCNNPHSGWACQNCCTDSSCTVGSTVYTWGWGHPDNPSYSCHSGCSSSQKLYKTIIRTITSTNYHNGGNGGIGAGYNQSLGTGVAGTNNAGSGGNGGSFGSSGNIGANGNHTNGTAGGGAGVYINGISFVTLTQNGTVQGGTA